MGSKQFQSRSVAIGLMLTFKSSSFRHMGSNYGNSVFTHQLPGRRYHWVRCNILPGTPFGTRERTSLVCAGRLSSCLGTDYRQRIDRPEDSWDYTIFYFQWARTCDERRSIHNVYTFGP